MPGTGTNTLLERQSGGTTAAGAAAALLWVVLLGGCSEAQTGPTQVHLDPADAELEGEARNKCWDDGCWWVVWCGHRICDGAWSWRFPGAGNYSLTWQHVSYKCAGSPPFELRINDEVVHAGRLAQYGSCGECVPGGMQQVFRDTPLGEYTLEENDKITLYVRNDFACGIQGPGAYAAFRGFSAKLRK